MRHPTLGIAIAAVLLAAPAGAQRNAVLLTGTVLDSSTGRPLVGTLVALTGGARATRTDVSGQYAIVVPRSGEVILEARRIGYEPRRTSIQIPAEADKVEANITLVRLQSLDTVRVRAADRALYGVVGAASDLRPLAGADVELLGAGHKTKSDSNGKFFIPLRPGARAFMVRARTKGFAPQTMSVIIPTQGGLEVALLLDSGGVYPKRLDMALAGFDERAKWRGNFSVLVPRVELMRHVGAPPLSGLKSSPSFIQRVLRFDEYVCIYVDGIPRPMVSLDAYDLANIEMIEAYTMSEPAARELAEGWPPRMGCSLTGEPRRPRGGGGGSGATMSGPTVRGSGPRGPQSDVVSFLVIWTKR